MKRNWQRWDEVNLATWKQRTKAVTLLGNGTNLGGGGRKWTSWAECISLGIFFKKRRRILDKPNYQFSYCHFLGGIIEACPPSDSITTVSLDVLIEPNGKTKIIAAADQVMNLAKYYLIEGGFYGLQPDSFTI